MLEDDFDYGVHQAHVDLLLDPTSWSDVFLDGKRKPRVFIDAFRNQGGNVEIRCMGGPRRILFRNDFTWDYFNRATTGAHGAHRSEGEIIWIKDFDSLVTNVSTHQCPAATALLLGFAARLDELIERLARGVDLVGAVRMAVTYAGERRTSVDFVPSVSPARLQELRAEPWD
ncbi:hypothetical protein EN943_01385 [Mesorhizobium sp. M7A.F.Ca.US.006.01.1.1]|uniref:hypothetical protein n=1 Tax=Mesorhizobium sp. M7A.F.Ca.US.006.01.1.1 TaxID=2496707 RepID=UPI000FCA7583|nr:hypothetical protein [Mesorhizobium sp. M7A.F.Ca.US.006.01.1.1]RUZ81278.1 hypothetical protein EN943_01385 [Mesorhizobium sp. M7A.F.Ca.US.006.01.1.1]